MSLDVITHASAGPFAAACLLLGVAGVTKIRRPVATQPAASVLGLPDSRAAVRALGAVELGAAGTGVAFGGPAAAAVAVVYAALAVAAWRLFTRAPGTPCGCLGASTAPASAAHVAMNVIAAIAAALAIAAGSPLAAVGHDAGRLVAFVVLVGCCTALVDVVIETLPALNASTRERSSA